jgi:peptidoglycan/xylan/chitin deacetylase (PgdA/CDA1 family)
MKAHILAIALGFELLTTQPVTPECIAPSTPVEVPILLYHHVAPSDGTVQLTVSPEMFETQMLILHQKGYTPITPRELSEAIRCGIPLPDLAVVITFDDGHVDNYEYAYPIMDELGFRGAMYVVANRTATDGFLDVEQLKEMLSEGWEIGSHSVSHPDLTTISAERLREELLNSRSRLEADLGIEIQSFAYPFGSFTPEMVKKVIEYGYSNAMGIGTLSKHSQGNLFYLSRHAVDGRAGLDAFEGFLEG